MAGNREPKGMLVNGILLVDKPAGITSNKTLQITKRLMNARKAGHTGSLDPIATGVLPICFGHATKISGMFLNSAKHYEVGIRLGVTTDSGDKSGKVLSTKTVEYDLETLNEALSLFKGEIQQIPPMYSALKQNGQRLYKLARKGLEVKREPRTVTLHDISVQSIEDDYLELQVHCSKGFYIRSLAMDIGNTLNCGAHVDRLRRVAVNNFRIDQCISLEQLEALESAEIRQNLLIPTDLALKRLPHVELSQNSAEAFCQGQSVYPLEYPRQCPDQGLVRLYSQNSQFLGLGQMMEGKITPKRVFA